MRCLNCDSNDWENVDQFRMKPAGMSICKSCGFVSYPSRWKSHEEIKEHYRKAYRNPPNAGNLFTGQRKLHYHAAFLAPLFDDWKAMGKTSPVVTEVGAAYGLVLHWMKQHFPGAHVSGTELTTTYRRNAYHEFGITLDEDFDDSKKYDLIISYKVAEHQLDVDRELRRYAEALSDTGLLYISVPTWFNSMCNFGQGGFDLEYYYDPNHVNVWTTNMFKGLLKKVGLEVLREDHIMYDSTFLCRRNMAVVSEPVRENPEEIKAMMAKIKEAYMAYAHGDIERAISIWPDYPVAHVNRAEGMRKQAFEGGWDWTKENIIDVAFKSCPTSGEIFVMATDFAMRFEKYPEAIKYAEAGLRARPESPQLLNMLINIMREMGLRATDQAAKVHYFRQGQEIARHLKTISLQHQREATDMIYLFNSLLPMPVESPTSASAAKQIA